MKINFSEGYQTKEAGLTEIEVKMVFKYGQICKNQIKISTICIPYILLSKISLILPPFDLTIQAVELGKGWKEKKGAMKENGK